MIQVLKNWTLPLAMLVGFIGADWLSRLAFLTPYLIFLMLLLTFCKISWNQLRIFPLHGWLLLAQLIGVIIIYGSFSLYDKIVAQTVMVCVICPTATAAAVVTHKLGGSAAFVTTHTLLSNLCAALTIPLFLPFVGASTEVEFFSIFSKVFGKIFPLLILPILVALLLNRYLPKMHFRLANSGDTAFYLWVIALSIACGQVFQSLSTIAVENRLLELGIAIGSLAICLLQFGVGRALGHPTANSINAGQSLGQKNTIFAIWMSYAYLHPAAALGPGCYIIWQNLLNSWQLWKAKRI